MPTKEKIELTGASKYAADLKLIAQQSKTLAAEMKGVTASFTKATTEQEKNEKKSEVLSKQIEKQAQYVETLTKAFEEEVKASGEDSLAAEKLRTKLADAQATLNGMESSLSELSATEEDSADSAEDLGSGLDDVGKSAKEGGEKTGMFGDMLKANLLSEAIIAGVKALAGAIKDIAVGIKNAYTDTVHWADDLNTLATNTGVSTEKLQELEYMAGLIDTDVTTVTGSMTKLTRNMGAAQDGTGAAAEAFKKLGISVTDSDGNLRDSEDVFFEVIDALGGMENATDRDATAMDIFGKSAQDLNSMIAAGSDKMRDLAEEAHAVGYVLSQDTIDGLVSSADAMDRLQNLGDSIKRNAAAWFSPLITEISENMLPKVQEAANLIMGLIDGSVSPAEFAETVTGWIQSLTETFVDKAPSVVAGLTDALVQALPVLIPAAAQMAITLIQGLANNSGKMAEGAASLMKALAVGLAAALPALVKAVPDIIFSFGKALVDAAPELWKSANEIMDSLGEAFVESLNYIEEVGTSIVNSIWNGIKNAKEWLKTKIRSWVGDIGTFLKNLFFGGGSTDNGGDGGTGGGQLPDNGTLSLVGGKGLPQMGTVGMNTVNIYVQDMSEAQVDYLVERVNRGLVMA